MKLHLPSTLLKTVLAAVLSTAVSAETISLSLDGAQPDQLIPALTGGASCDETVIVEVTGSAPGLTKDTVGVYGLLDSTGGVPNVLGGGMVATLQGVDCDQAVFHAVRLNASTTQGLVSQGDMVVQASDSTLNYVDAISLKYGSAVINGNVTVQGRNLELGLNDEEYGSRIFGNMLGIWCNLAATDLILNGDLSLDLYNTSSYASQFVGLEAHQRQGSIRTGQIHVTVGYDEGVQGKAKSAAVIGAALGAYNSNSGEKDGFDAVVGDISVAVSGANVEQASGLQANLVNSTVETGAVKLTVTHGSTVQEVHGVVVGNNTGNGLIKSTDSALVTLHGDVEVTVSASSTGNIVSGVNRLNDIVEGYDRVASVINHGDVYVNILNSQAGDVYGIANAPGGGFLVQEGDVKVTLDEAIVFTRDLGDGKSSTGSVLGWVNDTDIRGQVSLDVTGQSVVLGTVGNFDAVNLLVNEKSGDSAPFLYAGASANVGTWTLSLGETLFMDYYSEQKELWLTNLQGVYEQGNYHYGCTDYAYTLEERQFEDAYYNGTYVTFWQVENTEGAMVVSEWGDEIAAVQQGAETGNATDVNKVHVGEDGLADLYIKTATTAITDSSHGRGVLGVQDGDTTRNLNNIYIQDSLTLVNTDAVAQGGIDADGATVELTGADLLSVGARGGMARSSLGGTGTVGQMDISASSVRAGSGAGILTLADSSVADSTVYIYAGAELAALLDGSAQQITLAEQGGMLDGALVTSGLVVDGSTLGGEILLSLYSEAEALTFSPELFAEQQLGVGASIQLFDFQNGADASGATFTLDGSWDALKVQSAFVNGVEMATVWDLSALSTEGVIRVAVVPEPATATLSLLALAALAARRRRK